MLSETRRILKEAIRQGGTTVANYLNSQGEAGLFQVQLLAYGREGEPCRCGALIDRLVQAGRSTFFCPPASASERRFDPRARDKIIFWSAAVSWSESCFPLQ